MFSQTSFDKNSASPHYSLRYELYVYKGNQIRKVNEWVLLTIGCNLKCRFHCVPHLTGYERVISTLYHSV